MTPSSLELAAVYSAGAVVAINAAVLGVAVVRSIRRRFATNRPGTVRRDDAHARGSRQPHRVRSLMLLVAMAGLVASGFEVHDGPRPGWRAGAMGWRAGAFVNMVGFDAASFGPGDPRVGLRCETWLAGRSIVVYLGSKGGW
jgi:hypothetical protein